MGVQACEYPVRVACDLRDGGRYDVGDDLKDGVGNVGQHKGNPAGSHNTQPLILLGCDFVPSGFKVTRVYGGERGDVGIKLPTASPTEGCVASILQVN